MAEARRTLVKSPPELWALVSDPEALAKHLDAFGEIRITRVEPETTVAWEGDRARGTVELEASGWGTKVRLTAETVEVEEEPALQQPLAADDEEEPRSAPPEPEPDPEPEAVVEEEPPAPEPEPEPAVVEDEPPAAAAPEKRRRFFGRMFRRRQAEALEQEPPVVEEEPVAAEPIAEVAPPEPEPEPEPAPVEEPAADVTPAPVEEPADGEIRVTRLADDEAAKVLDGVLDTLGAAHHRPFSRS